MQFWTVGCLLTFSRVQFCTAQQTTKTAHGGARELPTHTHTHTHLPRRHRQLQRLFDLLFIVLKPETESHIICDLGVHRGPWPCPRWASGGQRSRRGPWLRRHDGSCGGPGVRKRGMQQRWGPQRGPAEWMVAVISASAIGHTVAKGTQRQFVSIAQQVHSTHIHQ